MFKVATHVLDGSEDRPIFNSGHGSNESFFCFFVYVVLAQTWYRLINNHQTPERGVSIIYGN